VATYAIGDVQGCFTELQALLAAIKFDHRKDRLWFVGDLVNRGPESLAVLRFVKGLADSAISVLGNHDLHLITVAAGLAKPREDDTLKEILDAPDGLALLDWLRELPMIHVEDGHVLVHAGLLPQWGVDQAQTLGREVEAALRGPRYRQFLGALYGGKPDRWSDGLVGADRLRVIVNAMTRMRFCTPEGVMEFHSKGDATQAPAGYLPWFDVPGRRSASHTVVCGHWSALGLRMAPSLLALDSGCVWGGRLSAVRLEDRALTQMPCAESSAPVSATRPR
jgi:bis(5'-nucleosyl)-tetraphosphatase (symmetrical)